MRVEYPPEKIKDPIGMNLYLNHREAEKLVGALERADQMMGLQEETREFIRRIARGYRKEQLKDIDVE